MEKMPNEFTFIVKGYSEYLYLQAQDRKILLQKNLKISYKTLTCKKEFLRTIISLLSVLRKICESINIY